MSKSWEFNGLVNFKNGIENGIFKGNTKDKVYFIGGKYQQKGKKGDKIDFTVDGQVQIQDASPTTSSFSAGENTRVKGETHFQINVSDGIADVELGHDIDAPGADPVVPLKIIFKY